MHEESTIRIEVQDDYDYKNIMLYIDDILTIKVPITMSHVVSDYLNNEFVIVRKV